MPRVMKRTIIVDAYNAIHQLPAMRERLEKNLESARAMLLLRCAAWLASRRDVAHFRLVFDGDSSIGQPDVHMLHGVQAIYTKTGETADDRIVAMVQDAVAPSACLVVTADRDVATRAQAHGAVVVPPLVFFENAAMTKGGCRGKDAGDKPELTSATAKSINDQLIREWGLGNE